MGAFSLVQLSRVGVSVLIYRPGCEHLPNLGKISSEIIPLLKSVQLSAPEVVFQPAERLAPAAKTPFWQNQKRVLYLLEFTTRISNERRETTNLLHHRGA